MSSTLVWMDGDGFLHSCGGVLVELCCNWWVGDGGTRVGKVRYCLFWGCLVDCRRPIFRGGELWCPLRGCGACPV